MRNPTDLALQVHRSIALFKPQQDAVAAHARSRRSGHVMQLDPMALATLPAEGPLAESPAALSQRLLGALFGRWPADAGTQPAGLTQCRAAVQVRELPWQAWLDAQHDSRCR